jgi:hypothetical protein
VTRAKLRAHGITATLPDGFEGRIFVRPHLEGEFSHSVAQFATFPLPAEVADFGGGAVTLMGSNDIFAVLFEYGSSLKPGAPLRSTPYWGVTRDVTSWFPG